MKDDVPKNSKAIVDKTFASPAKHLKRIPLCISSTSFSKSLMRLEKWSLVFLQKQAFPTISSVAAKSRSLSPVIVWSVHVSYEDG